MRWKLLGALRWKLRTAVAAVKAGDDQSNLLIKAVRSVFRMDLFPCKWLSRLHLSRSRYRWYQVHSLPTNYSLHPYWVFTGKKKRERAGGRRGLELWRQRGRGASHVLAWTRPVNRALENKSAEIVWSHLLQQMSWHQEFCAQVKWVCPWAGRAECPMKLKILFIFFLFFFDVVLTKSDLGFTGSWKKWKVW